MEEIVKNSISMLEFKKTQFLLEESKNSLNSDLENTKKELENKKIQLKEEKKLNYILIITTIILFIVLVLIWTIKI
jgi:cytoskeletal protein RodZ